MQLKVLCLSLAFFALALYFQRIWVGLMRRFNLGQAIKAYGPTAHKKKTGTPSMGGIVALALAPVVIASSYFCGAAGLRSMFSIWLYPLLAASVGLADDLLKLIGKSSEGLKSLQKLFLQIIVTIPWALWVARDGIYLTPTLAISNSLGIPLLVFLGVGIQNAVNVTDGLDGLAGSALAVSLTGSLFLSQSASVTVSAAAGLAILSAFLWHNSNPAELFMGDVGAHLWAGLLISLCVESRFILLIFPMAFLFGVEMVTVVIQIFAIRKLGKKVFLMSPLHHHYELRGWAEPTIVVRFCLAHLVGMVTLLIFVLTLYGGPSYNVRQ
jgi:phospho-N-acetylmuramoyl-pentapeptide-transferase